MKSFQRLLMVLGVALTWQVRAADTASGLPFAGKVVDSQGRPVADATADCYQFSTQIAILSSEKPIESHTTTDNQGAFNFPTTESVSSVVVKKPGMATAWKTRLGIASVSTDPLVLGVPSVLAGKVVDENGQPVEGAEVWVSMATDKEEVAMAVQANILFGKAARDSFSARTGADGRFRIENFPSGGQANLDVAKKGKALRGGGADLAAGLGNALNFRAGQLDIKLVVEPAGNIEGKVVVQETGQGLAGVKLQLQPAGQGVRLSDGGSGESIQSAADGGFRISDVPAGSYKVTAVFEGKPLPDWVAESDPVTVASGETARNIQVRASKGGVVKVTVVSKADQKPLSGVNIAVYNNSGQTQPSTSSTGDNGVAQLRLPPGTWLVNASKSGWSSDQADSTTVENGQTNQMQIELTPPLTIKGTVRGPSGEVIAGARLSIGPNYGGLSEATSDANGHYELNWIMQNYGQNPQFTITARSPEKNLALTHDIDEATTSLDLKLQPALTLAAKAQDAKGKPITNAMANVMLFSGNMAFMMNGQAAQADSQGNIRIEGLPQGRKYSMSLSAKGFGSANQQVEETDTETTHYDFPTFVLPSANLKLAGRVIGADGKPAVGISVQLNGEGQPNGSTKTDATGHFIFDAVCEGPINLFANSMNGFANTQTSGGDTNIVMRVQVNNQTAAQAQPPLKIKGIVTDSSGAPVAGVRLGVYPNYFGNNETKTDANGRYSFSLQNAQFIFQNNNMTPMVVARSLDRNLATAHDLDERTTNLDLRLEDGLTVSALVTDSGGKPLKSATATVMLFTGNNSFQMGNDMARADEQGRVRIGGLPQGQQYNIDITASGYGSSSQMLATGDTKTKSYDCPTVVLRLANRKLAGQVLGIDGKPVIGAQVNIQGQGQPNGNTRSDANGRFSFPAVCDGPVRLFAYIQPGRGGGGFMNANVQAQGGDTNVVIRFTANNNNVGGGGTPVTTTGTVFGPTGSPASGVSMMVVMLPRFNNGNNGEDIKSDADGKFSIPWTYGLPPGARGGRGGAAAAFKNLLIARDEDHNLAVAQEIEETTTSMDLHLQPGLTLTASVQDPNGTKLTSAQYLTYISTGNRNVPMGQRQMMNVDAQGSLSLSALPQGVGYMLMVSCPGHGSVNKIVSPAETQTASLNLPPIILKVANLELAGTVVDETDKPVSGAQVNFNGPDQPNGNTRADSKGHFAFRQVCEGPVTVNANTQPAGSGQFITGFVQAQGGDTNVVVKLQANQVRQAGGIAQAPPRFTALKPPPWSWAAISNWPLEHTKLLIVLLGVQLAALVATASGILWVAFVRKV